MADEILYDSPPMNAAVLNMQSVLRQNRDIRGGRETMMANKSEYINRLEEQEDDQYDAMAEMAPVYILYPKVVDGFVGVIFAKAPINKDIEFNDEQTQMNKNVDLLGNSTDKFSEDIVSYVLEDGFCASMNDYSEKIKRPFTRLIKPEQFVSFRFNSDDGYPKLIQFVFSEQIEIDDPDDEFSAIEVNQYTVLDFAPNPKNSDVSNYRVRIFQALESLKGVVAGTNEKVVLKSALFPKKNGEYFDDIPVKIHGIDNSNFTVKRSLIQDISDMNISVIQRTVDQVYMLHWTALPTAWITGTDDFPGTIGPSKGWAISSPEASVGMLEFSGSSARAHQDFIDNLLYIMAVMGAQILKKEGVSRETATSVLVRTANQTSLIATMVNNISKQLQDTYSIHYDWSGVTVTNDFEYDLNDDFIKVDMEPNAQIALVKSWLDGAVSHNTVFNKMKEGEIIEPNKTFQKELEDIIANPPPFFEQKLLAQMDKELAKINGEMQKSADAESNDIKGSNLENENVSNPLATE